MRTGYFIETCAAAVCIYVCPESGELRVCSAMAPLVCSKLVLKLMSLLISLVLVISLAPEIDARLLEKSKPGDGNGNVGNSEMTKVDDNIKSEKSLEEMKNLPPFPDIPFATPIPGAMLPPPIPGIPGIPVPQTPGFPFPTPFDIPNVPLPPFPDFPPLPPFQFPPIPFLTPPPA